MAEMMEERMRDRDERKRWTTRRKAGRRLWVFGGDTDASSAERQRKENSTGALGHKFLK